MQVTMCTEEERNTAFKMASNWFKNGAIQNFHEQKGFVKEVIAEYLLNGRGKTLYPSRATDGKGYPPRSNPKPD